MSKVLKRLLVFFIGIPAVLAVVIFNFYNHLILNIVLSVFSALAANEFYNMLSSTKPLFKKPLLIGLSCLLPILSYNFIYYELSLEIVPWFFVFEILFLMALESLSQKDFKNSLSKIAFSSLIIFYCGFLPTFISRMTVLENSIYIISLFFILVFMCDSCAWFFGILFGKNNRGHFAASPNKSLVGFFGGILGSTVFGALFKFIFSDIFPGSYGKIIFLGIITSLAAIIGDLIESVFKRSSDCKDSGTLIPGRGGVLDSIDSILVAAPIFYIGVHFLY